MKKRAKSKRDMESDYQDASEDSLAEHLEAVPPVVGRLVVCRYKITPHVALVSQYKRQTVTDTT